MKRIEESLCKSLEALENIEGIHGGAVAALSSLFIMLQGNMRLASSAIISTTRESERAGVLDSYMKSREAIIVLFDLALQKYLTSEEALGVLKITLRRVKDNELAVDSYVR